jgi:hypothetical protein
MKALRLTLGSAAARSQRPAFLLPEGLVDFNRFSGGEPLQQKSLDPLGGFPLLIFPNERAQIFAGRAVATFPDLSLEAIVSPCKPVAGFDVPASAFTDEKINPGFELLSVFEMDADHRPLELGAFIFVQRRQNAWIFELEDFAAHPVVGHLREDGAGVTAELIESAAHAGVAEEPGVGVEQSGEFVSTASAERAVYEKV